MCAENYHCCQWGAEHRVKRALIPLARNNDGFHALTQLIFYFLSISFNNTDFVNALYPNSFDNTLLYKSGDGKNSKPKTIY